VGWPEIDAQAKELRTRILVNHRLQASYIDKPVVGAGILGIARWMLAERDDVVRDAEWLRSGNELFAIAERVNARQDLHTLDRSRSAGEIRAVWGDDALDEALTTAETLDRNDAALRGLALLKELRF
jgi:hypothetical protein